MEEPQRMGTGYNVDGVYYYTYRQALYALRRRPTPCCFEHCTNPATHKVGGEVYFPMCDEHFADRGIQD